MLFFLAAVIVIGVVAAVIVWIVSAVKLNIIDKRFQTKEALKALAGAENALRRIANGAAAPELEAQIALDEINVYHERELN